VYVVLVEVCKGSLIEVVTGMSIIHSLGVMSTDSTTAVERRIMTVDRVYDDEHDHQATGLKGRTISVGSGSGGLQLMTWEGELVVDMEEKRKVHHLRVALSMFFCWHKNLK